MIAVPDARPKIVCPGWCTVTYEEHVANLRTLEGFVIHWSDLSKSVFLGLGAFPDGTPDPDDPPLIHVGPIHELSVDAAEDLGPTAPRGSEGGSVMSVALEALEIPRRACGAVV